MSTAKPLGNRFGVFLLFLLLPLAVGGLGGWATAQGVRDWYPGLVKPPFNPPSWVFGPVWTSLYLLMGIASHRVWMRWGRDPRSGPALGVYGLQLFLNGVWSFLFFAFRSPGAALVDIVLLWAALATTVVLFFRVDRWSGWLMTPYLAWVTFASVLNYAIWTLNP